MKRSLYSTCRRKGGWGNIEYMMERTWPYVRRQTESREKGGEKKDTGGVTLIFVYYVLLRGRRPSCRKQALSARSWPGHGFTPPPPPYMNIPKIGPSPHWLPLMNIPKIGPLHPLVTSDLSVHLSTLLVAPDEHIVPDISDPVGCPWYMHA